MGTQFASVSSAAAATANQTIKDLEQHNRELEDAQRMAELDKQSRARERREEREKVRQKRREQQRIRDEQSDAYLAKVDKSEWFLATEITRL